MLCVGLYVWGHIRLSIFLALFSLLARGYKYRRDKCGLVDDDGLQPDMVQIKLDITCLIST